MTIRYFSDTDALLIEFRDVPVAETRDLEARGKIRSIAIEHASTRANAPRFWYEEVAA